ncbi:MAG: hypothetical protein ACLT2C_07100 [Ruminococcus sp.]
MLEQLTPRVFYLPFSKTEGSPSLGYIRGDRFLSWWMPAPVPPT